MFTGIIEELGTVESLTPGADPTRLQIRSPHVLDGISLGDSIAVNGCCLTVTSHEGELWSADVISTTLAATSLGDLTPGDRVNLERCVRVDARLDGHIVQGHVDGTGAIVSRTPGEHWEVVRISLPDALDRYVVEKGSIAVDGTSLTVSAVGGDGAGEKWFEVSLIPTTLDATVLGGLPVGARVNLEVDVVAKYIEKMLAR